jgi:hypothetical protein
MTMEILNRNVVAESIEDLAKKLKNYKPGYDVSRDQEFEGMDSPLRFIHIPYMEHTNPPHEFISTPDKMLNSSEMCTKCDCNSKNKMLKKIKKWLDDRGFEYETDVAFPNSDLVFDLYLTNVDETVVIDYLDMSYFNNVIRPRQSIYDKRKVCQEVGAIHIEIDHLDAAREDWDETLSEYLGEE